MAQFDIKDKNVVVTGGAAGLGALYIEAFLKEGAKKIAMLDVAEMGKAKAAELSSAYEGQVVFFKCDVGDEGAITETFEKVHQELGRIDVIVNNAGIMNDSDASYWKSCVVNWPGTVAFTMKGLKHMRKDEGGCGGTIVNISSTAALAKLRVLPIYAGSKMAVLHFGLSLAEDPFYEETGVRVLTICFGPTDTALLQNLKTKTYTTEVGAECEHLVQEALKVYKSNQKPESAVKALLTMLKDGENGTVWLALYDRPVQNITPTFDKLFTELDDLVHPTPP